MADPPSLFPLYTEQIEPGTGGGGTVLADNIIVIVDNGPEIVLDVEDQ